MKSIRKKILSWLLVGQLLAATLAGTITFFYVRSQFEDLLDARLVQLAYSVSVDGTPVIPPFSPINRWDDGDDDDFMIQVWEADGTLVIRSTSEDGYPDLATEGFSSQKSAEKLWRTFVLRRGSRFVQTSQPFSDRLKVCSEVALGAVSPVLLLIVVFSGFIWVSVGYGLRPLEDIARTISKRRPYSLEPLPLDKTLPDEVKLLVTALNDLLQRLGLAMEGQRKFIADAAHELRTPLTAVQLQAQLLQRATGDEERDHALQQIRSGTTRASHLIHQLLTLARLEPEDWQRPFTTIDVSLIMKSVVSEQIHFAFSKEVDLGVVQDDATTIMGDAESLRIMLGNLIDNAIRYAPTGGRVDVALISNGPTVQIEIQDNGPGIPEEEREEVFARFYRRANNQESGSGLGLAIVREIVERHQGRISLEEGKEGRGLKVIVMLPIDSTNN